ncbi:MAG: hypothetical protein HKO62_06475 [Gammaproteobacteria bacterium]|nr:hypothetical protein [Gammaproteobacteria bacterium]
MTVLTRPLLSAVQGQFQLDLRGVHGLPHWGRVRSNGLRLARRTGADVAVVELFALFHDARRLNEYTDPEHGARGAALAASMRGRFFALADEQFDLLCAACRGHSEGGTEADVTVMTCWDADRLDLGRVGIEPEASYLCTEAAREREMMAWAWQRSLR